MTTAVSDNRTRDLLPFRVQRGRGEVFLEFDAEIKMFDNSSRTLPFQIQAGQPMVKPILRLLEMYCALEDSLHPLKKQVDSLTGERGALEAENSRLKKSVDELRRQNEALRKERRG